MHEARKLINTRLGRFFLVHARLKNGQQYFHTVCELSSLLRGGKTLLFHPYFVRGGGAKTLPSKRLFYSRVSVAISCRVDSNISHLTFPCRLLVMHPVCKKACSDIIDGDITGCFVVLEPDCGTTAVSCLVYLCLLVPMIAVTGDVMFLDRLCSLFP